MKYTGLVVFTFISLALMGFSIHTLDLAKQRLLEQQTIEQSTLVECADEVPTPHTPIVTIEQSSAPVPIVLTGVSVTVGNSPYYTVEKITVTLPDGEKIEMDNGEWKEIEVYLE